MTERPILFSAPMVRALLDGRKTQTRRLAKGVPPKPEANCHKNHTQKHPEPYLDAYCSGKLSEWNPRKMSQEWCWWQVDDRQCLPTFKAPCAPGDVLWVRETWQTHCDKDGITPRDLPHDTDVQYPATYDHWVSRKRPGIHMPRWASRISLRVTDVRIERLQDISEEDAKAEGCDLEWYRDEAGSGEIWPCSKCKGWQVHGALGANYGVTEVDCRSCDTAAGMFCELWKSINGEVSWAENPWVWAISFSVEKKP